MYQALYRKYRPRIFDDVVGQAHITDTLKNQVQNSKFSHAYLFIGTRGTGKTTCAKILAKAVNCEHPVNGNPCNECPTCRGIDDGTIMDVVELDAASNNGVDNVRALRDEAIFTPAGAKKRVYIIDEVHMLSISAFNALLKIMEEPPEHLIFILATTELKKVPATILSRCQRYSFRRIDASVIADRLSFVADQEQLNLSPEAAALLGRLADGSMRDGLSLLDQVLGNGTITVDSVLAATGLAGNLKTVQLLEYVINADTSGALTLFGQMWQEGKDPAMLLGELAGLLRDILLMQTAPHNCDKLLSGNYDHTALQRFTGTLTSAQLLYALETVQDAQEKMRDSRNLRMTVELCLIALCDPSLSDGIAGLRARISKIETLVKNGATPLEDPGKLPSPAPKMDRSPLSSSEEREIPSSVPEIKEEVPAVISMKTEFPAIPEQPDDLPPWEDAESAQPPEAVSTAESLIENISSMPLSGGSEHTTADTQWTQFITVAKQHLPAHAVGLLYQCYGIFTPDTVTICAPDFPYAQLTAAGTMEKLQASATAFCGQPVTVNVTKDNAGTSHATRSLEELKQYNIVKFK